MDFVRVERSQHGEETNVHGGLQGKSRQEALRGDRTVQQIAAKHGVHPNQVSQWKCKASAGLVELFERGAQIGQDEREAEIRKLHEKIGQLVIERDFLKVAWER